MEAGSGGGRHPTVTSADKNAAPHGHWPLGHGPLTERLVGLRPFIIPEECPAGHGVEKEVRLWKRERNCGLDSQGAEKWGLSHVSFIPSGGAATPLPSPSLPSLPPPPPPTPACSQLATSCCCPCLAQTSRVGLSMSLLSSLLPFFGLFVKDLRWGSKDCLSLQMGKSLGVVRHSSGAVWESRCPSWAVRPNEPYGFRGRKAILNHAHALVSACPLYANRHPRTLSTTWRKEGRKGSAEEEMDVRPVLRIRGCQNTPISSQE